MKKKVEQRFVPDREYKYDTAMKIAMEKAKNHPKPVSMTTKVPEYTGQGSNK